MTRKFKIEWPDFGVVIPVELLDQENPELCEVFWQCLPFETIFAASMSAGEMFKVPIPFTLPDVPVEKLVAFAEQPVGTLFSLGWGSLLLKYGIVVEPFRLPVLGRVVEEDLDKLRMVAVKLRDAYFFTKEINLATFKKA